MVRKGSGASGYRQFGGKRFTLHCRSKLKSSAEKIKKEMRRGGWLVRITKSKEYYPYQVWIRRKK